MDVNINFIILAFLLAFVTNVITYLSFTLYMQAKWKGRKPPLGIVANAVRNLYMLYVKAGRRKYRLEHLEHAGYIRYIDWDRGFGWGFMQEPMRRGDQIFVKYNKKKSMLLMVYQIHQPIADMPEFFLFRTFYVGMKDNPKEDKFTVPANFQRKD